MSGFRGEKKKMMSAGHRAADSVVHQYAKFIGCINPLEMEPSFLIPVFRQDGDLVLQESDPNERIKNFYAYDQESLGTLKRFDKDIVVRQGDPLLYAFVFSGGKCVVETREALARRLLRERPRLAKYKFLYMEVLAFIGFKGDLRKEIEKIGDFYADRPLISENWVSAQKRFYSQKKTSFFDNYLNTAIRGVRTERVGVVASDKMAKTVVVRVDRLVRHPKYRRYIRRTSKFMAHDEFGASIGDKVRIVETRPLSKRKRWRVTEIVRRADN